jgi:LmbE family N-acetylglucosaminyl deacetylase
MRADSPLGKGLSTPASFCSWIFDHSGAVDASETTIVVAHPDDETIGFGALLARLANVRVIVMADGAPRDGMDARRAGFATWRDYARARRAELRAALATANVAPSQITELGTPDQEVCRLMASSSLRLAALLDEQRASIVFTHAFEGGHPDHDATAFCVHAAARLLGSRAPLTIEAPFYHLSGASMRTQAFCDGQDEVVMTLSDDERRKKTEMIAAHVTQAGTLRPFQSAVERYRSARPYDFTRLPNNGRALYALYHWGLEPQEWPALAAEAMRRLKLRVPA